MTVEISQRLASMRAFFDARKASSILARKVCLRRLAAAIRGREDNLLAALRADLGKPTIEAYASEVGYVLGDIAHALRHLDAWARPRRVPTPLGLWPGRCRVESVPAGVVLILGPWNYPLQLLFSPLVSALAAGNCACLKPSEFAPHTAQAVASLAADCFDPGHVAVIQGGPETAEALLAQRFDHVFFTGSTPVGKRVMAAAAHNLTPVTLELGGKSPCVVCADASLRVAARRIVWGKFLNAGQTCVAPDYALVHRSVADRFLALAAGAVGEFFGPDPKASPDYARIVSRGHVQRLAACLASGRVVCGGQTDADARYVAPTILAEPDHGSPAMQEEIFGPILPVLAFDDLRDAVAAIRARPPPLVLYVFAGDRSAAKRIADGIECGSVAINETVRFLSNRRLPFGGVGASGMGRSHGQAGFECFSRSRSVLDRSARFDPRVLYPPYRIPLALFRRLSRLMRV
jgi:aldehyde dehydrogenase (NAD+)